MGVGCSFNAFFSSKGTSCRCCSGSNVPEACHSTAGRQAVNSGGNTEAWSTLSLMRDIVASDMAGTHRQCCRSTQGNTGETTDPGRNCADKHIPQESSSSREALASQSNGGDEGTAIFCFPHFTSRCLDKQFISIGFCSPERSPGKKILYN